MKRYLLQGLSTPVLAASLAAERSKHENEKAITPEEPCCIPEECCAKKPQ
jgi:hypothetical protein